MFCFNQQVLLLLFEALASFCGHIIISARMFSQSLLDLDQYSLSQHTVFIPELLMVFSKREICIFINEKITPGLTDLLHQDPLNGS
jgi:hypothetical protein